MPSPEFSRRVKSILENDREDLRRRIDELEPEDSEHEYDENFADSGQVAAEQNENQTIAASLQDQLDDVERALGRIAGGTYGTCTVCGKAIEDARLEAMPAAHLCIEHAGAVQG